MRAGLYLSRHARNIKGTGSINEEYCELLFISLLRSFPRGLISYIHNISTTKKTTEMSEKSNRRIKRSRSSIMRQVRAFKVDDVEINSPPPSEITDQESNRSTRNAPDDVMQRYSIIQMGSLISLMKQTLCIVGVTIVGMAFYPLKNEIGYTYNLHSYVQIVQMSPIYIHHLSCQIVDVFEINVRLAVGGPLSGIGYSGVKNVLGAMNLSPPIKEKIL